jgi:hypothetical protein
MLLCFDAICLGFVFRLHRTTSVRDNDAADEDAADAALKELATSDLNR